MKTCLALVAVCMIVSPGRAAADHEAEARRVLTSILAKDYVAAAKNFNEQMMAALPPGKLGQTYEN